MYSMTKPIVSVGLMMLYEEGRFQIDDPVSKYIPQLKGLKVFAGGTAEAPVLRDAEREMTIRDVLGHTSGLGSGRGNGDAVSQMYREANLPHSGGHSGTLEGMMEMLGTLPLVYDPGKHWLYGISTNVVARLIEVISGQRLDVYLRERILTPLGMHDTGFDVPESEWHRFAACYEYDAQGKLSLQDAPATSHYRHPARLPLRHRRHGLHDDRLRPLRPHAGQRRRAGRRPHHRSAHAASTWRATTWPATMTWRR